MAQQYRRDRVLVQQVRQALAADPAETHSAQGLAGLLNLSVRTLHRQLKEEGASLQQLKDEVRCERAKDLLYRSEKPVKQVAAATGFRNEKSFIRAFRAWTGKDTGGVQGSTADLNDSSRAMGRSLKSRDSPRSPSPKRHAVGVACLRPPCR